MNQCIDLDYTRVVTLSIEIQYFHSTFYYATCPEKKNKKQKVQQALVSGGHKGNYIINHVEKLGYLDWNQEQYIP